MSIRMLILFITSISSFFAYTHDARPLVVDIMQQANSVILQAKIPSSLPATATPELSLSGNCTPLSPTTTAVVRGAYIQKQHLQCEDMLAGKTLSISFPYINPSLSTLVKVSLSDQEAYSSLLSPEQNTFVIPNEESIQGVSFTYMSMGMLHIWAGLDHLLFVACLMLLARTPKRIVWTVSGFTIGHSVTLVAGALGYVSVPAALFESLIGLSIAFMAVELYRQDKNSWSYKYPMSIAIVFGLLHGLGFASVLQDVGLPQVQVFWGLFAFNLGIEIGQLVFVLVLLIIAKAIVSAPRIANHATLHANTYSTGFIYVIGGLAGYWFWDRSLGLFF